MKSKIYFYIICPANVFTGGPTAQHQLALKIKAKGYNVFMNYYPSVKDPVHQNFKSFNIPYVEEIPDSENSYVIMPEAYTEPIFQFKHVTFIIWWLSIDNYLFYTVKEEIKSFRKFVKKCLFTFKKLFRLVLYFDIHNKSHLKKNIIHLAQSQYAYDYLTELGLFPKLLHCYLGQDFQYAKYDINKKENIIMFNPKKGREFTQELIKNCPEFTFVRIENMTPSEVKDKLCKAKVYIDFGDHPGRDRFPREAAILGCCIITGKKGSAGNKIDIPIAEKYKFDQNQNNFYDIKYLIKNIFDDFHSHYLNFDNYRNIIQNEELLFENELGIILDEIENNKK
jgi:hypothetical protein